MLNFVTKKIYSNDECNNILNLNTGFKDIDSSNVSVAIPSKRKSLFGKVSSISELERIVLPALNTFGIKSIENSQPMFIQYNQGDYFLPHTDTPYTSDPANARIYTLVIQLSESFDYLGGDLIVDGNVGNREKGSIILFRSNKIHELTEVKQGQRNILVCMFPFKDLDLHNTSIL